jgi:hypothetical protein
MIDGNRIIYPTPYIIASSSTWIQGENGEVTNTGKPKTKNDFNCFCLGVWIGTHGSAPSAYGSEQFSTYEKALEKYNLLKENEKPYTPILGVDENGLGWYIIGSYPHRGEPL